MPFRNIVRGAKEPSKSIRKDSPRTPLSGSLEELERFAQELTLKAADQIWLEREAAIEKIQEEILKEMTPIRKEMDELRSRMVKNVVLPRTVIYTCLGIMGVVLFALVAQVQENNNMARALVEHTQEEH